jgi:hypothetical protein
MPRYSRLPGALIPSCLAWQAGVAMWGKKGGRVWLGLGLFTLAFAGEETHRVSHAERTPHALYRRKCDFSPIKLLKRVHDMEIEG